VTDLLQTKHNEVTDRAKFWASMSLRLSVFHCVLDLPYFWRSNLGIYIQNMALSMYCLRYHH